MPGDDGKLTSKETERCYLWAQEKWKETDCPCCGITPLALETHLVQVPVRGYSMIGTGLVYPFVVWGCDNCGYARLISAVSVGIVAGSKEEEGGSGDE